MTWTSVNLLTLAKETKKYYFYGVINIPEKKEKLLDLKSHTRGNIQTHPVYIKVR